MGCKAETVHTDCTFGPGAPKEHEVPAGTKIKICLSLVTMT